METKGTGAGQLDLKVRIGQWYYFTMRFRRFNATTQVWTDEDISAKTFSFIVKKNYGDRLSTFTLTNGNGITVPIYSTNEIRIDIQATNTLQEEGEYVYELWRRDLNRPWVSGKLFFQYKSDQ